MTEERMNPTQWLQSKLGTKVTSWSSTVSNDNIPSEKLVKDYIDQQIGLARNTNFAYIVIYSE